MSKEVFIEAPIAGALIVMVWKLGRLGISKLFEIGKLAILKWSDGDAERTRVFAQGIADIARSINELRVDHGKRLGRIEGRLDLRDEVVDAIGEASSGRHAVPEPVDDDESPPLLLAARS